MTDEVRQAIAGLVADDDPGVAITVIAGDGAGHKAVIDKTGHLLAGALPQSISDNVVADALTLLGIELSVALGYDDVEVFFETIAPRPHLFVFGAVHIAQELVGHASLLGYRIVVADPRPAFLTAERFPEADELRVGWPGEICSAAELDRRTFVVVLTHDRRFEDPLWPIALASDARYIGAMGSAKTTAKRRDRLLEDGFTKEQVDRIHGPIGLKIGSRGAGETAVAILGEMISVRYSAKSAPDLIGVPLRP